MLTFEERQGVLKQLWFYSKLNLFPTRVNLKACTVVPANYTAKWRVMASPLLYLLLILGTVYKNLSLLYSLLFLSDPPFHQLMFHAVMAGVQSLTTIWYYMLQYKYPAEYSHWATMTLSGNISGGNYYDGKIKTVLSALLSAFVIWLYLLCRHAHSLAAGQR